MVKQVQAIQFHRDDDETLDVWVIYADGSDVEVGHANHDEHGWAGMEAVENLAKQIASVFGVDLIES